MIRCMECGKEYKIVSHKHLFYKHSMTIEQYKIKHPNNCITSEETCKAISDSQKISMNKPETKSKIREASVGRVVSFETREKIRIANTGKTSPHKGKTYDEIYGEDRAINQKKKISFALRGRKYPDRDMSHLKTEEFRKKASECKKGEKNPMYGKSQSIETRNKISNGLKNSGWTGYWLGKENPNKGKSYADYMGEERAADLRQRLSESHKKRVQRLFENPELLLLIKTEDITVYDYNIFRGCCLRRDEYKCRLCGVEENLDVHHIKLRSKHPNLVLDINNGITLCVSCHMKQHPEPEIKALFYKRLPQ